MSLQKYRADVCRTQPDNATVWYSKWIYSQSPAKILNCRWESLNGNPRITAYVQGEADTFFSIPAKCRYKSLTINGYLTGDGNGNLVFRHTYY